MFSLIFKILFKKTPLLNSDKCASYDHTRFLGEYTIHNYKQFCKMYAIFPWRLECLGVVKYVIG